MIGEDESGEHGTKLSDSVFPRVEDLQDTVRTLCEEDWKHTREKPCKLIDEARRRLWRGGDAAPSWNNPSIQIQLFAHSPAVDASGIDVRKSFVSIPGANAEARRETNFAGSNCLENSQHDITWAAHVVEEA